MPTSSSWTVETLNDAVDAELDALPADMRARFVRIAELIETAGLPKMREPYVKHLRGRVWEMRLSGRAGIARALYVAGPGRRVVVVRVFTKKTRAVPAYEIATALRRARELDTWPR
jgi:phage-related protein